MDTLPELNSQNLDESSSSSESTSLIVQVSQIPAGTKRKGFDPDPFTQASFKRIRIVYRRRVLRRHAISSHCSTPHLSQVDMLGNSGMPIPACLDDDEIMQDVSEKASMPVQSSEPLGSTTQLDSIPAAQSTLTQDKTGVDMLNCSRQIFEQQVDTPMDPSLFPPPRLSKDNYEMLTVFGSGSWAQVRLVKSKDTNRVFAIKILKCSCHVELDKWNIQITN